LLELSKEIERSAGGNKIPSTTINEISKRKENYIVFLV
jgi:hypothetical protein